MIRMGAAMDPARAEIGGFGARSAAGIVLASRRAGMSTLDAHTISAGPREPVAKERPVPEEPTVVVAAGVEIGERRAPSRPPMPTMPGEREVQEIVKQGRLQSWLLSIAALLLFASAGILLAGGLGRGAVGATGPPRAAAPAAFAQRDVSRAHGRTTVESPSVASPMLEAVAAPKLLPPPPPPPPVEPLTAPSPPAPVVVDAAELRDAPVEKPAPRKRASRSRLRPEIVRDTPF